MADDLFGKIGGLFEKGKQILGDRLKLDIPDLIRAIDQSDKELVERTMTAGLDPNKADSMERLALPMAVDNNNAEIVALLLGGGANPNLAGKDGESPLFKAVTWESSSIVKLLLRAGADVNKKSVNGNSPLEEAKQKGYAAMIELMENFASIEREERIKEDKATHEKMKNKAKEAKDKRALKQEKEEVRAAQKAQKEADRTNAKLFKQYKVEEGNLLNPLIKAIEDKDQGAIELFAQKVQDINAFDASYKATPLVYAVEKGYTKLCRFLIKNGANPFLPIDQIHHSALTKAVMAGDYDLVQIMMESFEGDKADLLNDKTQELSAQFLAYKDARTMDLLLSAGADPYFGGSMGSSPVLKAIEKGTLALLPVLQKNGIDLNKILEGKSLITWAIDYKRMDWVMGLIDEEINLDLFDENGETALMHAVRQNNLEVVRLLLEGHADPTFENKEGKTALDLAKENEGAEEIISLLE